MIQPGASSWVKKVGRAKSCNFLHRFLKFPTENSYRQLQISDRGDYGGIFSALNFAFLYKKN